MSSSPGGIGGLPACDDPAGDRFHADFIRDKDGVVMGRGSFEAVAGLAMTGPCRCRRPA